MGYSDVGRVSADTPQSSRPSGFMRSDPPEREQERTPACIVLVAISPRAPDAGARSRRGVTPLSPLYHWVRCNVPKESKGKVDSFRLQSPALQPPAVSCAFPFTLSCDGLLFSY